ncbi:hypothetical protein [Nocardia sp. NPDC046763]|uniref:hypothetical protein n=1 Tax=Nocardia sp. NPDC046763 TaxID=3155256 RepID=UPI00340DB59C
MSTHRSQALECLNLAEDARGAGDRGREATFALEAATHAALAIEARLGELVAATELGLVINATVTGVGYEPGPERTAARTRIRERIAEIVSRA